jgi:hypothetical protein
MFDDPVLMALMNQYNAWYAERWDELLEPFSPDQLEQTGDLDVDSQPWFDQQLVLQDETGAILFSGRPLDGLGDQPLPGQVLRLLDHAAALMDGPIPKAMTGLLAGAGVAQAVFSSLMARSWQAAPDAETSDDWQSLSTSRLLEALGANLEPDQLTAMLDKFLATPWPADLVTGAIKTVLAAHNDLSTPLLTQRLSQALADGAAVEGPVEYLMILLSEAGRDQHPPESFAIMRTAFQRAENKQVAAICLGDFGDPRGIAVLRVWLDSHPDTDRATRLEIKAAIARLGGEC